MLLQRLRRRLQGEREAGFTLIELMVVVLIIAILIAIAIPTFLGARQRAQDRAAQSNLRNGLTSAKTIYTDAQSYANATNTALQTAEPSLTFVVTGTASTTPRIVSVNPVNANVWAGAAQSASGECFYIKDDLTVPAGGGPAPGTTYGRSRTLPCTGTQANTSATLTTW